MRGISAGSSDSESVGMQITFLGGADEVGASCILLKIAGKTLLIDAGIRISPRSNRGIDNSQLPDLQPISQLGGPDFVLVTHAHTDHTGALPLILEQYRYVPVIATAATQSLTRVLQHDAQRIMKSRQEAEGELPLFDEIAVQRLLDAFETIEFNRTRKLAEDLQVTYYTAGHIAGAALLAVESGEGTLVVSGDVSKSAQRTVKSLELPSIKADALILESTYGGRLHANRVAEEKRLVDTLRRVTERGGKVLIPAFALGRAQELIQIILARGDALGAPVYVDGMVRAVCDAYATFRDILPSSTLRTARDDHLFFRGPVRPIRSSRERLDVAQRDQPLIVVSSSGMLTGGASVVYARHFAADERNAILLTGYQDEESPGRFLQRIMQDRQSGQTPLLKLGDAAVKVRCEIDTYALSAHADEMELVSFAEALGAQDTMLVHGDAAARHSLATALRQRGRSVTTPSIGQSKVLTYKARPWALGKLSAGSEAGDVDLPRLWESLKGRAGDHLSVRELSQLWWGSADRADEMERALASEQNVYFAGDWRDKKSYKVRTSAQVERTQRCRAIMLANPDIIGKLIVMRNSNGQARLAIVNGADSDNYTAVVQGQRGARHPADALLWVIGDWRKRAEGQSVRANLSGMMKEARACKDRLLPLERRRALADAGEPVLPASLLPAALPPDIDEKLALTAIVLALAEDGATLEAKGLLPRRALDQGPLEQNEARALALRCFPAAARLRKVGMHTPRKRLLLSFDFPATVKTRFSSELERLAEESGWDIEIRPTVNQQALGEQALDLLPESAVVKRGPAYHIDKGQVSFELADITEEQIAELRAEFRAITGFELIVKRADDPTGGQSVIDAKAGDERMEINAAYRLIRARLEGCGLNKVGLKGGEIMLSFISPQVGERHLEKIEQLAQETGYPVKIHPQPNQHEILQVANRLLREQGWQTARGPGIHVTRAEVNVTLTEPVAETEVEKLRESLLRETGFNLVAEF